MKLQNGFFMVKPFNPNPYFDPVIVDLSGSQKFEEDTIFKPGRYRIELAPGVDGQASYNYDYTVLNMSYDEIFTTPFIVRAYCGGNGNFNAQTCGTNPYSGEFKVNGIDARTISKNNCPDGIDVNHIFGAGGGNTRYYNSSSGTGPGTSTGGGPNCLGNGSIERYSDTSPSATVYGAAGSCLHILPISGVFGTDYFRAYHAAPSTGSAYGGGDGRDPAYNTRSYFGSRGGNSPYGNGGKNYYDSVTHTTIYTDTGIGGGNQTAIINGTEYHVSGGAYFNGTQWNNAAGYTFYNGSNSSYIRITYLGPLV